MRFGYFHNLVTLLRGYGIYLRMAFNQILFFLPHFIMITPIVRSIGIWTAAAVLVVSTVPVTSVSAMGLEDITTKLQLTGYTENCGLMLNWTTLSTWNETYADGYALIRTDLDSKSPFAMLRKTNANKDYYHFVQIPAGSYTWKVVPYAYDIQGFKYGKESDALTLNVACNATPTPVPTPLPVPVPLPLPILPPISIPSPNTKKATVSLSVNGWENGKTPTFSYSMKGKVAFDAYRLERWKLSSNGIKIPGSFISMNVDKWSNGTTWYNVEAGATYLYRMVAVKNVGSSKKIVAQSSNTLKVSIPADTAEVGVPDIISPDDNAILTSYPRQVMLRWGSVPNTSKYRVEIQCDTCGNADWQTVQTYSTPDTSFFTPALAGDHEFRFRVQAVNNSNTESEWSEYSYFSFNTSK